MPVIRKEVDELRDVHKQVEQLLVALTSSLQIILGGARFEEDVKERISAKILKDTVSIIERLVDVINRLEILDSQ